MFLAMGEVTLVNGAAVVPVSRIMPDAVVILSRMVAVGTIANMDWSIQPKQSFTITSLQVLDRSIVRWAVLQ